MIAKHRLMNVGTVTIQTPGGVQEQPAYCVEISALPESCSVLLLSIFRGDEWKNKVDPVIMAKIRIDGTTTIVDPVNLPWGGNGRDWLIVGDQIAITCSPKVGEHIWLDPEYGRAGELSGPLRKLYAERRSLMRGTIETERWLAATPLSEGSLRDVHKNNLDCMRTTLSRLERQIADMERHEHASKQSG